LHDAAWIGGFDVNEGMRITKYELHQLAFDLDFGFAVVRRTERVMSICSRAAQ
jgi:hypothetical protein